MLCRPAVRKSIQSIQYSPVVARNETRRVSVYVSKVSTIHLILSLWKLRDGMSEIAAIPLSYSISPNLLKN